MKGLKGVEKLIIGGKLWAKDTAIETVAEGTGEYVSQVAQKKSFSKASLGESVQEAVQSLGMSSASILKSAPLAIKNRNTVINDTKESSTDPQSNEPVQPKSEQPIKKTVKDDNENAASRFRQEINNKLKKSKAKAAEYIGDTYTKAASTLNEAVRLLDFNENLKKSELMKESKEAIEDIVTAANDGQVKSVYFDAKDFEDHFVPNGESPLNKANEMIGDGGASYTNAKMNGGSIEVPLSRLISEEGGKDSFAELVNKMKFTPDGDKVQDSLVTIQRTPEELARIANIQDELNATEKGTVKDPLTIEKDTVPIKNPPEVSLEKELKRQLEKTNIDSNKVESTAKFYGDSFTHLAKRKGITAEEFQQKYFPNVKQLTDRQESSFIRKTLSSLSKETNVNPSSIKGYFSLENGFSINLFKKADFRTFIHEMGHYYVELIRTFAQDDASFKKELASLYEYVGAKEGDALNRAQEEKLAEAYETYMRSGQAPNARLLSVFSQFKEWLKALYTSAKDSGATISNSVRGVFDRLIALDEEIEDSMDDSMYDPLFSTAEEAGMSDEEFNAYKEKVDDIKQEAISQATNDGMKALGLNLPKEILEEKARLKKDIKEKLNEEPGYIAKWYLWKHKKQGFC